MEPQLDKGPRAPGLHEARKALATRLPGAIALRVDHDRAMDASKEASAAAARAEEHAEALSHLLGAELARTDPYRTWLLPAVTTGLAVLALIEAPMAYAAAQVLQLPEALTELATLLIITGLLIAALLTARAEGATRALVVALVGVGLIVLGWSRDDFLVQLGSPAGTAALTAIFTTSLTLVVLVAAHGLLRRVEPVRVFRHRFLAFLARRRARRAREQARRAQLRARAEKRANETLIDLHAGHVAANLGETAGEQVGRALRSDMEPEP
jgi:hypothetical protein